jgi:hypothetical protein
MDENQIRKCIYVEGVIKYITMEYDLEIEKQYSLTPDMLHQLNEDADNMECYPNAAGKLMDLIRSVEQF